ncbi:uncharacterized protein K460DRAFT_397331 [Cucurbitaria berberidis CBS 394.84]|uniref:Uncharacterized protein n=1 Tax=Cucurbitaria berberidis CBS 394.84 TaxID=1168544 RepID=A0A9P4L7K2_9PLEO|nr:uncharacterized protein K460DRAFT_397331 [Cucurbitaria berberidis CBS 394.84]KAF1844193.1 hypothetical protein K460DRAFT_397331 [Cucurbitaria berberidis CBS 394.84]
MLFTPLLALAFTGSACATWVIEPQKGFKAKNDQQAASISKAYVSAVESYYQTLTTGADWTKAWDVMRAYQQTGKDVPEAATASNTVLTYTTTPAWYNAIPTEAKTVFDGMNKKKEEIQASVLADQNTSSEAARPLGRGLYLGGAITAVIAGLVVVL